MRLRVQDILAATKGKLLSGDPSCVLKGVSTDSRSVKAGDLFVAIIGGKFDGHRFLSDVVENGAGALVVSRSDVPRSADVPIILVDDTVKALGEIALFHRRQFSCPVIAITGSAGKTSTKNLLSAVLRKKYRVLFNEGTKNNHIGVPQTLLQLTGRHTCAVIEMGTNRPGDIAWLTAVCEPDIAIMTNVGESHLALLKSPAKVFAEKAHLVSGMKGRTVIYNQDNFFLRHLPRRVKNRRFITFGRVVGKKKPDYLAADVALRKDNRYLSFRVNKRYVMTLRTPALSNVHNALAAIACGRLLKIPYPLIAQALKSFVFKDGRLTVKKVGWGCLIDDTYNANPVSMRNALTTLALLHAKGRKILVCADMLELGPQTTSLHRQMGELAGRVGLNAVFAVGKAARSFIRAAHQVNRQMAAKHFSSLDELHRELAEYLRPEDVVLVKGSRGMKMERTVHFLENHLTAVQG